MVDLFAKNDFAVLLALLVRVGEIEDEDNGVTPSKVLTMPQGLDRTLKPAGLIDLLPFLESLRERRQQ